MCVSTLRAFALLCTHGYDEGTDTEPLSERGLSWPLKLTKSVVIRVFPSKSLNLYYIFLSKKDKIKVQLVISNISRIVLYLKMSKSHDRPETNCYLTPFPNVNCHSFPSYHTVLRTTNFHTWYTLSSTLLTSPFSYSREEARTIHEFIKMMFIHTYTIVTSVRRRDETKRQSLCALRINFHEITYREGFNPREGFNLIRKRYVND